MSEKPKNPRECWCRRIHEGETRDRDWNSTRDIDNRYHGWEECARAYAGYLSPEQVVAVKLEAVRQELEL